MPNLRTLMLAAVISVTACDPSSHASDEARLRALFPKQAQLVLHGDQQANPVRIADGYRFSSNKEQAKRFTCVFSHNSSEGLQFSFTDGANMTVREEGVTATAVKAGAVRYTHADYTAYWTSIEELVPFDHVDSRPRASGKSTGDN